MKLSTFLAAGLAAATSTSAYRISLYSSTYYGGTRRDFTTNGSHNVGFTVRSWVWDSPVGDGCCVRFCRGSTDVGYYCGSASNPDSTAGVNKVVTGCGSTTLRC